MELKENMKGQEHYGIENRIKELCSQRRW